MRALMILLVAWLISAGTVAWIGASSYGTPDEWHVPEMLLIDRGIYCFGPSTPTLSVGTVSVVFLNRTIHFRALRRNVFVELSPTLAAFVLAMAGVFVIPGMAERWRKRRGLGE